MVEAEPGLRFEALRMISGITILGRKARLGTDQVMAHPFWMENT